MIKTRIRTAGIWIEDGQILLESFADAALWGIPGGKLEAEETAEAGCVREYREEIELEMRVDGLAILHENFWREGEETMREYGFYFRVRPASGPTGSRPEVRSQEAALQFRWIPLTALEGLDFVPAAMVAFKPHQACRTNTPGPWPMGGTARKLCG